jgi:rhodanese-related sulfurtransferase
VTLAEIGRLRESAAFVLDVRTRADHAAGHLHGATGIEEGGSMLAYVGWLVPFNAPLGIVSYDVQQAERATTDLFRIGYEDVRGFITAGSPGVAKASTDVIRTVDVVQAAELLKAERPPLFDLRFRYEQLRDPLPGATERPIDQFNDWAHEVEDGTLLVCGSGQRATMAASLLQARGRTVVVLREVGAIELRAILAASA